MDWKKGQKKICKIQLWKIQEGCMTHRGCGKKSNICTTGVLKGKEVKNEIEEMLDEVMAVNFPKLMESTDS